jgi:hypothetical protein
LRQTGVGTGHTVWGQSHPLLAELKNALVPAVLEQFHASPLQGGDTRDLAHDVTHKLHLLAELLQSATQTDPPIRWRTIRKGPPPSLHRTLADSTAHRPPPRAQPKKDELPVPRAPRACLQQQPACLPAKGRSGWSPLAARRLRLPQRLAASCGLLRAGEPRPARAARGRAGTHCVRAVGKLSPVARLRSARPACARAQARRGNSALRACAHALSSARAHAGRARAGTPRHAPPSGWPAWERACASPR